MPFFECQCHYKTTDEEKNNIIDISPRDCLPSKIPKTGNKTMGSKLVTAIGMASVIHKIAIKIAVARVIVIAGFDGFKSTKKQKPKKSKNAPNRMLGFI